MLRQEETLWLITTALLQIPVYQHIFNMMRSIYLQDGIHQRVWVWTHVRKRQYKCQ